MSDLTREEAIKILKDTLYDEKTPNDYIKAVKMARESLENQKTGHWEETEDYNADVIYRCSVCESAFYLECDTPKDNEYNYCPYCGARMEDQE